MKTYTVGDNTYTEKQIVDEYKYAMKVAAKVIKAEAKRGEDMEKRGWTQERLARRNLEKGFEMTKNGQELANTIMKVGKSLEKKKK